MSEARDRDTAKRLAHQEQAQADEAQALADQRARDEAAVEAEVERCRAKLSVSMRKLVALEEDLADSIAHCSRHEVDQIRSEIRKHEQSIAYCRAEIARHGR